MYNRVIIAEKPDMGDNIAKALGLESKKRGYITLKSGDVVTWGIGHLIRLKKPDAYEKYKQWSWEALPVIPDVMETEVDPNKIDQFNIVKSLIAQSKEVVLATDPDREGEYIGRLILNQAGYTKKYKRLWIDDLTEATIQGGMQRLRSSDEFQLLGDAAHGRSLADYWLGFTASRVFTLVAREATQGNATLSAGRVQTPTLRLVYDREIAMENFTPASFYGLQVDFQSSKGMYKGQWFKISDEGRESRIDDEKTAKELLATVSGQQGMIEDFLEKEVRRQAPQLLNSSALKTEARKQLGFSTVRTTDTLQALYDKEFVSYPRADSRHLSENKADELASHLAQLKSRVSFQEWFPTEIKSLKGKTRYVDDKKAVSHHAIVPVLFPTDKNLDQLSADQLSLYKLILKHTLAAHHPEGLDREISFVTRVSGETFQSKAVTIVNPGWRKLLAEDEPDEKTDLFAERLPSLSDGESVKTESAHMTTGKTSKPKRLNDDELEKLMENAGKFVDDQLEDDALELIKAKGIGTPATRTNIVQSIVTREYIEIKKNLVYLTPKGRSFMEMVYEHPVSSIELTGEFEMKLNEVEKGTRSLNSFLDEFKTFTTSLLDTKDSLIQRLQSLSKTAHSFENVEEIAQCPKCQAAVIESQKSFSCTQRSNGCTFSIWKEFRGQQLRSKQVKDLIAGKSILLKNIEGKEGKKYDMLLFLQDHQLQSRFPTADDQSLGNCPKCSKPVIEGTKGFGCSGWRDGCKFTIWKSFKNTMEWKPAQIKQLLNGKEIELKDFGGDKGSLYVQLKDGVVSSRSAVPEDKSLGPCPKCKQPVNEYEKSYGCSAWKSGCSFRLSKVFLGKAIEPAQIKKLLKSGKTDKLEGFTGKKGLFDTALGYDIDGNRYTFLR